MKVIGIPGEAGDFADRLVGRLAERGSVGRIAPAGVDDDATDATETYRLGEGGQWAAAGDGMEPGDALDRLAPECDYAVLEGHPDVDVPRVAIGDHGLGDPLVRADAVGELDLDRTVEALEDTEPYETLGSLVARAKRSSESDRSGAIATFTGRVRARDGPEDPPTEFLEFEKYDGVAEDRMARIREELESRDGVFEVVLHHRTGVVEAGEDIVFVVVLAGHRREAFRTVEDGIDRLKDEVPLFKREVTVEEEFWVHDRE
jgi:molybdopterin synthase catalytic subunit